MHSFTPPAALLPQYLLHEYHAQVMALKDGLCSVVPGRLLSLLTANEFEGLVCGSVDVDLPLLRRHTRCARCLQPTTGPALRVCLTSVRTRAGTPAAPSPTSIFAVFGRFLKNSPRSGAPATCEQEAGGALIAHARRRSGACSSALRGAGPGCHWRLTLRPRSPSPPSTRPLDASPMSSCPSHIRYVRRRPRRRAKISRAASASASLSSSCPATVASMSCATSSARYASRLVSPTTALTSAMHRPSRCAPLRKSREHACMLACLPIADAPRSCAGRSEAAAREERRRAIDRAFESPRMNQRACFDATRSHMPLVVHTHTYKLPYAKRKAAGFVSPLTLLARGARVLL